MDETIEAIQTQYNGYAFRSRLEARWAVFFDTLGIKYEYEKEGYDLGDLGWYLPDFWIPELNAYFEIKPLTTELVNQLSKKFYCAGKVHIKQYDSFIPAQWRNEITIFDNALLNGQYCIGPETKRVKHSGDYPGVVDYCLKTISESDIVFAWIDSFDCHGTLSEIGYAKGIGKKIWVGFSKKLGESDDDDNDLWFIENLTDHCGYYDNPKQAFLDICDREIFNLDDFKCRRLSNKYKVFINRGNPWPNEQAINTFVSGSCQGYGVSASNLFYNYDENQFLHACRKARAARFDSKKRKKF